ncbi:MAG: RnfABCDGE type electron transport complex subunit A [Oscillospiraceae bacterium]|jgi:electron transport complex protein RnfA|nr:RnfABCDGE type electron transport complex subunit A [Oscillospiraceae bacterium]MBQ9111163.1 RnfABCDGE type electron transport complex subunit A [Oscillospiraceae bacterium]
MTILQTMVSVMLAAILTDNYVLSKFMGICPFLGVSKKLSSSLGMGAAVIFVMACAAAVTYPVYQLLVAFDLAYLQTVAFILIIALFVQLVEIVMRKLLPPLYKALGVYLPLITTNCAVLGVTLNNIDDGYSFGLSVWNAVCVGMGFTLSLIIFAGVRSKLENADIPETFKGIPATLIAASIVSLSFSAFSGMI